MSGTFVKVRYQLYYLPTLMLSTLLNTEISSKPRYFTKGLTIHRRKTGT